MREVHEKFSFIQLEIFRLKFIRISFVNNDELVESFTFDVSKGFSALFFAFVVEHIKFS